MKKYIGETINDYVVIDSENINGETYVVVKCNICSHIRKMKIAEFRRVKNIHSVRTCKEDYFITNPIKGDYEFVGASNSMRGNKNLYDIKCKVCGNIKSLPADQAQRSIFYHSKINCGEKVYLEEIGNQYGDIKIKSYEGKRGGAVLYGCECQICGREKIMQRGNIKEGKGIEHRWCSMSLKNEKYIKEFRSRWANMRDRTTNPKNDRYHCYGGRGISSDEFEYFIDFYDCLYDSFLEHVEEYGVKNTTLERIDVNKGYTKENCTWTTWDKQHKNKQDTVYFRVVHQDGTEDIECDISKYEKDHNMSHNFIFNRLYNIVKTNEYNGDKYYLIGSNRDKEGGYINEICVN